MPIQITDETGYITDRAVREAFERICEAHVPMVRSREQQLESAEAFLRLVERYAAKGRRLIPFLPERSNGR